MASSSSAPHSKPQKNWLIRTRNRQILGPVSKEKLVEFVRKGALAPEDEVMSGNGYWFSISEKDLLEKYLFGDIPQSFNPISEAPSVLSVAPGSEFTRSINPSAMPKNTAEMARPVVQENGEEVVLPADDDLAYPDLDNLSYPDVTRVDDDKAPDSTLVINLDEVERRDEPVKEKKEAAAPQVQASSEQEEEEAILPNSEDLEYPE